MNCPICKKPLEEMILASAAVNYCPFCLGLWFEEDELRQVKDAKDRNLRWFDIDLWRDKEKFKISHGGRLCPSCRLPLYEVYYGDSGLIVDICNVCEGVWLDGGEFAKIISWLKKKADYEILNNYAKSLGQEAMEVFTGPESFREEVADLLAVAKVLQYKLLAQYPIIREIISVLPK